MDLMNIDASMNIIMCYIAVNRKMKEYVGHFAFSVEAAHLLKFN